MTPQRREMTGSGRPPSPRMVRRRARGPHLPEGWPALLVLWGFGPAWVLGMTNFAWPLAASVMAASLLVRRRARLPPGSTVYLLFLVLIVPSAVQVFTSTRGLVWSFRFATYVASGVIFVWAFNLDPVRAPISRFRRGLAVYWATIVIGGLLALIIPTVAFPSALEVVLPRSIAGQPFVAQLIEARVAHVQDFIGFEVARPTAPFFYTNVWGGNLALATAGFAAWASAGRNRRAAVLVAGLIAAVPIVQSLNRGLWLSLGAGLVYAMVRQMARSSPRKALGVLAGAALTVMLITLSPLGDTIALRAEEGHSDARREDLYVASLEATLDHPFVGNGGPVDIEELPDDAPPAGTHGHIWLLLVSHGIPSTVAFLTMLMLVVYRTRSAPLGSFAFWTHIMFVMGIVQLPIYALLPSQLPVMMFAAGLAMREERQRLGGAAVMDRPDTATRPTGPSIVRTATI